MVPSRLERQMSSDLLPGQVNLSKMCAYLHEVACKYTNIQANQCLSMVETNGRTGGQHGDNVLADSVSESAAGRLVAADVQHAHDHNSIATAS